MLEDVKNILSADYISNGVYKRLLSIDCAVSFDISTEMKLSLIIVCAIFAVVSAKHCAKLKKKSLVDWETSYGTPQIDPGFYVGYPYWWNQPYSRSLLYDPYEYNGYPEAWNNVYPFWY
ncbi:unnamed protein product [Leptosia nina]|uniref:Uncharacterized protein n=1 Tax=Leptosia nina TaxID=320188 RepID=A0AAV1JZW1_9NEOP